MSASHRLFVCTSCRLPGQEREPRAERGGARLHRNLVERYGPWADREGIIIAPYECLSACARPCAIALRAPGKFTYVFGDATPGETESAIIECASLFRRKDAGFLPRDERPVALQAAILARIPPLELG